MSDKVPPARILFVADFCGKASPPEKPIEVTSASLEAAIQAMAPEAALKAGVAFRPRAMSDFGLEATAKVVGKDGLDAFFHDPAYQTLESAWLGLADALRRAAGSPVRFEILSASRDVAVERFHEIVFPDEYEDRSQVPLALIACDYDYTHNATDLVHLGNMGKLGEAVSAAWVVSAGAGLFGIKNLYHLGGMQDFTRRFTEGGYSGLRKLEESTGGRWVGMTVNRFLLRRPHADEALGYREKEDAAHPEWRPWGRGVWLAAAAVGRSYTEHGHAADLDGVGSQGDFADLVTFDYPVGMREKVQSPTETIVDEMQSLDLVHSGVSPLIGKKGGNRAYFAMLANLYRPEPGSLLLESSLAYQLILGDLVHVLVRALPQAPRTSKEATVAWAVERLKAWMEPYGDPEPGDLDVQCDGRSLSLKVKLPIRLHNHDPEIVLDLPI